MEHVCEAEVEVLEVSKNIISRFKVTPISIKWVGVLDACTREKTWRFLSYVEEG